MKNIYSIPFLLLAINLAVYSQNIEPGKTPEKESSIIDVKPTPPIPKKDPIPLKPIGYYKDALIWTFSSGPSIAAPSGSYIDHEKLYDQRLRDKIALGIVKKDVFGFQARYEKPYYEDNGLFIFSIEKGITDFFSLGFSIGNTYITAKRSDIQKEVIVMNGQQVTSYPTNHTIYNETHFTVDPGIHFLKESIIDPFVKLRLGTTFFSGEAHQSIDLNTEVMKDKITNGRGFIYGGSAGVNFHINRTMMISLELIGLRRKLHADQFHLRTLESAHALIGLSFKF